MVDATQNLPGTLTSVTAAASAAAAPRISTSQSDPSQTAQLGVGAPVSPAPSAERPAVEVNSVAGDVLAAMRQMPPPIDITAVNDIKAAIAANEYPLDYEKISAELIKAFEDLA